jgi:hypothetical protein
LDFQPASPAGFFYGFLKKLFKKFKPQLERSHYHA